MCYNLVKKEVGFIMSIFELMDRPLSVIWEAFVEPYKPFWIGLVVAFAIVFLFSKISRFKFGR